MTVENPQGIKQITRVAFIKSLWVQILLCGAVGVLLWSLDISSGVFPLFLGLCFSWVSFLSTQLIIKRWLTRKSMAWTSVFVVLKYAILGIGLYILVQSYIDWALFIGVGFFIGTVSYMIVAYKNENL